MCGVSITDLRSERRHAKSVRARQIYFFVARKLTPRSLPAIGREAGDRDHSTVLHGVRKVEAKRAHFEPELSQILAHFPKDTP
ncbi:MAG: helix-turn-helix domain-containing protein [Armatimonadia bacterium]